MNTIFKDKNILIGISGGIAAYKGADLTSRLLKLGANVKIIMTHNATKFIHPLTLESLSGNQVYHDTFERTDRWDIDHIALAKWAEVFVIAPATANVIGKAANGIADDLLSTTILATEAKIIFGPAMNTVMYQKEVVQHNIDTLKGFGYTFVPPGSGRLACGDWGEGKLADMDTLIQHIEAKLYNKEDMKGMRVLVTAGPTREAIDPVRFITNHSSGKMGYAIAQACLQRGAMVELVTGPTNIDAPVGARVHGVETAQQMHEVVLNLYDQMDIIFKSAAVADYRVKQASTSKIKKDQGSMTIELERNPDILLDLGKKKQSQILVGFAAETDELEKHAFEKLESKNLDFIIANEVGKEGSGFKSDFNKGIILSRDGERVVIPLMDKKEFAHRIIDEAIREYP
ncbi:MAG TPA: bifunctional phosphopantothenoylcysteine decarboxylase/phosphopantothenate--cysteine ligase CoaBC [Clostridia bacterium]|nr:bifunctional phosphopantothenoylcysteine decarboxylase/phosphopantothenate--cysteine ligase CoaBC [Clostridia bacterium]